VQAPLLELQRPFLAKSTESAVLGVPTSEIELNEAGTSVCIAYHVTGGFRGRRHDQAGRRPVWLDGLARVWVEDWPISESSKEARISGEPLKHSLLK
jgi:hypothetical protein